MKRHGFRIAAALFAIGIITYQAHADESAGPAKFKPLIQQSIDREIASLDALYKTLHTHPELSYEEAQTSARMAHELRAAGFEVTTKVGGYGVVGVLKNGAG